MAIRDYWVYQRRQSDTAQWALYIVKEYEPGKPDATCLDVTIYSEDYDNETNSKSFIGWKSKTVSGYVNNIVEELVNITMVTNDDYKQLEESITSILQY